MHMLNNTRISLGAVGGPPGARRSRRLQQPQREALAGIVNNLLFRCHTRLHMAGVPYLEPGAPLARGSTLTPALATAAEKDHFALTCAGALGWADTALEVAVDNALFQAQARAQLYRGHCFRATGRWRRALECYIRAASIKGIWWGRVDIEGLTQLCRAKLAGERRASEVVRRRHHHHHHHHQRQDRREGQSDETLVPSSHAGDDDVVTVLDADGHVVGEPRARPSLRRVQSTPDLKGEPAAWTDEVPPVPELPKGVQSFAVRVRRGSKVDGKGAVRVNEPVRTPEGIFF